jgi:hypothetical protein
LIQGTVCSLLLFLAILIMFGFWRVLAAVAGVLAGAWAIRFSVRSINFRADPRHVIPFDSKLIRCTEDLPKEPHAPQF